jgi:dihydroflavonol-4-reductase
VARVFVTGASGLIGGALVRRLVARGDEVVALARSDEAAATVARLGAQVVRGDALDEAALRTGMEGASLVFHVAGMNTLLPVDEQAMVDANVRAPAAVVRAAARAGVPRVVHTSAAAIGEAPGTVGRESSPHRGWYMSPYERTKHQGERAAFEAGRREGVEVVSVNPSSVQGPGRSGGTGRILLAYLNGRLPVFVDTRLSLVDIDDCVEAHLLAAERGVPGERYLISGATLRSLEALELVAELTGVRHRVRMLSPRVAIAAATVVERGFALARRRPPVSRAMVRTMLHGHWYDGSRAVRELGLRYTPLPDTLARTVAWAVAEGHVRRPLPRMPRPAGFPPQAPEA